MIDVESPPAIPPLPSGFPFPRPPDISVPGVFIHSNTEDFLGPQTILAQVMPPTFHRSWCYRNSRTTFVSLESEAHSFKPVPGWLGFHYPQREPNEIAAPRESSTSLPAPQAISPGSWLKANTLRRSQSTTVSVENGGTHTGSNNCDESANTKSPVLGPSR